MSAQVGRCQFFSAFKQEWNENSDSAYKIMIVAFSIISIIGNMIGWSTGNPIFDSAFHKDPIKMTFFTGYAGMAVMSLFLGYNVITRVCRRMDVPDEVDSKNHFPGTGYVLGTKSSEKIN